MLFTYPSADDPRRGYAVYSDGKVIGFLGTIISRRTWCGRVERVCNFSTCIVDGGHPNASILLTRPVLAEMDGYTIVGFTPSPSAAPSLPGWASGRWKPDGCLAAPAAPR